ncbi:hypothetical protein SDC9_197739 [bioreactor metagenome]|uniref:Uncharacterized protein n=1 Tax=bioreactor metagenome TaxID=1076179 RepID=A0A645ISD0_9ZZZZ
MDSWIFEHLVVYNAADDHAVKVSLVNQPVGQSEVLLIVASQHHVEMSPRRIRMG